MGPKCLLWVPIACISTVYTRIYMQCKKIYDTMKYKKMNGWYFFNFYASMVNIYYEFLHSAKLFTWGLHFYSAMMRIFILYF
jgi:hypothetical protein